MFVWEESFILVFAFFTGLWAVGIILMSSVFPKQMQILNQKVFFLLISLYGIGLSIYENDLYLFDKFSDLSDISDLETIIIVGMSMLVVTIYFYWEFCSKCCKVVLPSDKRIYIFCTICAILILYALYLIHAIWTIVSVHANAQSQLHFSTLTYAELEYRRFAGNLNLFCFYAVNVSFLLSYLTFVNVVSANGAVGTDHRNDHRNSKIMAFVISIICGIFSFLITILIMVILYLVGIELGSLLIFYLGLYIFSVLIACSCKMYAHY